MVDIGFACELRTHALRQQLGDFHNVLAVMYPHAHCIPHHHGLGRLYRYIVDLHVSRAAGLRCLGASLTEADGPHPCVDANLARRSVGQRSASPLIFVLDDAFDLEATVDDESHSQNRHDNCEEGGGQDRQATDEAYRTHATGDLDVPGVLANFSLALGDRVGARAAGGQVAVVTHASTV